MLYPVFNEIAGTTFILLEMTYLLNQSLLESIWEALKLDPFTANESRAESIFQRLMEKSWAFHSDVEDLIDTLEPRLSYVSFDVVDFSKAIGIQWERVSYKPSRTANTVSEFDALRIADLAALLIILEQIGFSSNPDMVTYALLPSLQAKHKQILTRSEVDVYWFEKARHKSEEIVLTTDDKVIYWFEKDKIITSLGYTIKLNKDESGVKTILTIAAPKFRKQPLIERAICEECGYEWRKGDPDSSYHHRKEHARRMKYLDPKPHIKLMEERKANPSFELVRSTSPPWKHQEVYLRAQAFRREFHFDFVQWRSPKGDSDPYVHGYLFANDIGIIVGACSFRYQQPKSGKKYWALDWVWICPKQRRNGHLSKRWKQFREQFGDFLVTPPVSDEMTAFLQKKGESHLMTIPK